MSSAENTTTAERERKICKSIAGKEKVRKGERGFPVCIAA
jgi:hypothetical protein